MRLANVPAIQLGRCCACLAQKLRHRGTTMRDAPAALHAFAGATPARLELRYLISVP